MKSHILYNKYLIYLKIKKVDNGKLSLMKISESSFLKFIREYEYNEKINNKINSLEISLNRNKKLNDILDEANK